MAGAWLIPFARRFVHEHTFDLVVSPAIADLQFETPTATLSGQARGYAAVWRALAGGVWLDIARDARLLRNDAALLITLSGLQACYYGCMLVLAMEHLSPQRVIALIVVIVIFSAAFTVLGFWPGESQRLAMPADDV